MSELRAARADLEELIRSASCNPILIRLGWHDAGTYDKVGTLAGWQLWCARAGVLARAVLATLALHR